VLQNIFIFYFEIREINLTVLKLFYLICILEKLKSQVLIIVSKNLKDFSYKNEFYAIILTSIEYIYSIEAKASIETYF
jgi:hypothetical protein